jgi:hypothetical protein
MKNKIKNIFRKNSIILFYLFRHPRKFWRALSRKTKIRSGALLLAIIIIAIGTVWLTSKKTEAAWWNDLWQYRKSITVTNSSGSNLTDFQVKILDNKDLSADITAGKIQASLNDLRFTDVNGNVLPYWIEDSTAASVDAWIKVPNVYTAGTTVYMYYGNPSATSLVDGKKVFEYFDDFNDNVLDTAMWTKADSYGEIAETGGKLVFTGGAGGSWDQAVYLNTAIARGNMAMQFDYQWTSNNASYDAFMFGWKDDGAGASYGNLVYGYYNPSADTCTNCSTVIYEDGGGNYSGSGSWIQNTNYKVRVRMRNSGGAYYDQSADGGANWTTSYTSTYSTESSLHPAWTLHSGTHNVDNFFVRKDATTAPSAGTPAAEEKTAGPTAYFSFDEGYGATAYDETANANNGTITGATWKNESESVSGKSLYFNGVSSANYVNLGNSAKLNPSNFTISSWVKYQGDSSYSYGYIYSNSRDCCGTYNGIDFRVAGGSLYGRIWNSTAASISDPASFPINQWVYVTFSYDGNTMKLYRDGKLAVSASSNLGVGSTASYNGYIGAMGAGPSTYDFKGYIDEFKIYSYVRTDAQIKADYNAGLSGMGKAKEGVGLGVGDKSDKWLTDGLVGWWKMDEASWGSVLDSSGVGNTGAANGGATVGTGKFGNGGSFDGSDDYVFAGSSPTYNFGTGGLSVSSWVYVAGDANGNFPAIVEKSSGDFSNAPSNQKGFYLSAGYLISPARNIVWGIGDGGGDDVVSYSISNSDLQGRWHHLVGVADPVGTANAKVSLYVDGVLVSSANRTRTNSIDETTRNLYIGAWSAYNRNFNGKMDDLRIYKRALSPSEVSQLYNWAPGPYSYWKMDENSGTTVYDIGTGQRNLSFAGGGNAPTWSTGKFGGGIALDGSDDYMLSGTGYSGFKALTMEGWVNFNRLTGSYQFPIDSTPEATWRVGINSSGNLYFDAGSHADISTSTNVSRNTWHHIAVTAENSTSSYRYVAYLDGVNITSGTVPSLIQDITDLRFGTYNGATYPTDGKIDDMRIYDYARTQKQIVEDMNGGHPAGGSPVASQVGYWKFDEGYGGTAYNLGVGGSALNGNLGTGSSVPAWTNDGKFGKALSFDGNDYINISNANLGFNNGTTVSAGGWFYINIVAQDQRLIQKQISDGWNSFALLIQSDGKIQWTPQSQTLSQYPTWVTNSAITTGWHHIFATFNKNSVNSSDGKIFIDGVDQSTSYAANSYSSSFYIQETSNNLFFGVRPVTLNYFFSGKMDEVKIYNSALTADEIKLDMNQGKSLIMGSAGTTASGGASFSADRSYCPPGDATASCAPVGEWKMDERVSGNNQTLYDTSSNGNNATAYYGANATGMDCRVSGKYGGGCQLDGSDDYISMGTAPILSVGTSDFSLEAWVNVPSYAGYPYVISKGSTEGACTTSGNQGYALIVYNTGKVWFKINTGSVQSCWTLTGNATITPGWHHIAATAQRSGNGSIYVDGKLDTTSSIASFTNTLTNSNPLVIGYSTAPTHLPFNGTIDQVQFYNYARSASQVAWDYNRGKPVGWWKMDEGEGTSVYDWSGNGNTGTMTSMDPPNDWVAGKYNKALDFDGSDDYVSAGTNTAYNFGSDFTISSWFKTTNAGERPILSTRDGTGFLYYGIYGGKGFIYYNTATPANITTNKSINDNVWHNFMLVRSGTTSKLYVDGALDSSPTQTGYSASNGAVRIGHDVSNGTEYFPGQIDDVRIYNYALTAEQVKQAMNDGAIRYGP